jgi:ferredoxin
MALVITEPCIDVKDKACVNVCPIDCIHEADRMLFIDQDVCIDCGMCEQECPVAAIFFEDDLPPAMNHFRDLNKLLMADRAAGNAEIERLYPAKREL